MAIDLMARFQDSAWKLAIAQLLMGRALNQGP